MSKPNKNIAFLLHNYFEQVEYEKTSKLLENKGYQTVLITTNDDKQVQGMSSDTDKTDVFTADLFIKDANMTDYDAVIIPGGTVNADRIRVNKDAQTFVQEFNSNGKIIAAICHAPWLLINSGLTQGKTLTAYPSLEQDIKNSGATFVDKESQRDGNIITSRKPADIEAFVDAIDNALSE